MAEKDDIDGSMDNLTTREIGKSSDLRLRQDILRNDLSSHFERRNRKHVKVAFIRSNINSLARKRQAGTCDRFRLAVGILKQNIGHQYILIENAPLN